MPWALLELVFFADVAVWILTGFLQVSYSLSATFFAVFYVALAVTIIRLAGTRSIPPRHPSTSPFIALSWFWIAMAGVTWGVNLVTSDASTKGAAFDLLIPLSIALAHLIVWIMPWDRRTWRRVVLVFAVVLMVDVAVSAATIWLVNVTGRIPGIAFFLNSRYPVILFHLGAHTYVRTPGIFESGGTNGSFLIIAASVSWAYALLAPASLARRSLAAALTFILSLLVIATLTRRSVLGLLVMLFIIGALAALANRRYALVGLLGAALLGGVGVVVFLMPGYFEANTLSERFDSWSQNLNYIADLAPWRFVTGYGELQSSVDFTRRGPLALLDNGAVGLLVYGGIFYVGLIYWFYWKVLRVHLQIFRTKPTHRWKPAAAVGLLGALFVVSQFSVFFTNVTEAMPCLIGINLFTRHLVEASESEERKVAAA